MNYKSPVYMAMDYNGDYEEDLHNLSEFYEYTCQMPSGQCIERSARFFSRMAFLNAMVRWNKEGNPKGYIYFYDAMSNGAYGIPDPNAVPYTPQSIGRIEDGVVVYCEELGDK